MNTPVNFVEGLVFIKEKVSFWNDVKLTFDSFDKAENSKEKISNFILTQRKELYPLFDNFFDELWEIYINHEESQRKIFKTGYEKIMFPLLGEGMEINSHIRNKPLGYGGDFITMNYIYDYNSNDFLGKTAFQKLINNYTCNIDVACSNIVRKDFIKQKILSTLARPSSNPKKILSIGSGSAREIEELIRENEIDSHVDFYLVDFEPKAISYVRERFSAIPYNREMIRVQLIKTDLIKLIKDVNLKTQLTDMDLIYISGVFDYLSDRICKKITQETTGLLNKDGQLLIANMSAERARHQAYYELFGGWEMHHRNKDIMIDWASNLKLNYSGKILAVDGCKAYHFLKIENT